jgi:hypothetical protein
MHAPGQSAENRASFAKTGESSPEKVAEVMAVTNQKGYVEAYTKIAATVAREAYAMDKQDWSLLKAQYTDDACFETSADFGKLPDAVQAMLDKGVCGHDAIVAYVKIAGGFYKVDGTPAMKPGLWNQHVYTNIWLEKLDGNVAWARGYVAGLGRIEEDYLRGSDGIWRIKRKKIIANNFDPTTLQQRIGEKPTDSAAGPTSK